MKRFVAAKLKISRKWVKPGEIEENTVTDTYWDTLPGRRVAGIRYSGCSTPVLLNSCTLVGFSAPKGLGLPIVLYPCCCWCGCCCDNCCSWRSCNCCWDSFSQKAQPVARRAYTDTNTRKKKRSGSAWRIVGTDFPQLRECENMWDKKGDDDAATSVVQWRTSSTVCRTVDDASRQARLPLGKPRWDETK